eukprot:6210864-Pleurochrysis_carterae.AAC.4
MSIIQRSTRNNAKRDNNELEAAYEQQGRLGRRRQMAHRQERLHDLIPAASTLESELSFVTFAVLDTPSHSG